MGRRLKTTPRGKVRRILAMLFLHSRERQAALKRDGYTCQCCGLKQSRAKGREAYVEVHHIRGVIWDEILNLIYEWLLCDPKYLVTLCRACHREGRYEEKQNKLGHTVGAEISTADIEGSKET